ncbi:radical SAM protein [Pyrodictium occultum]|uniref:Radical SAM protein n=1 Tax=Pyrodictium occultum TaxID=2309 RepID=A0A0V8RXK5_PYROC|nr:radical SAM protein [Pyrodictium occultum]KSW12781.1 radical SAM protein [Pyrodictium occultum]
MMSNHHGREFIGFMTTGPAIGMPERVWMWLAAPKVETDELGRPREAPYGLRKIEAKLVDAGFNAAIVDPDHLHKHLDTMKVLMIGHHDYFAYGPPSSEWWMITGKEPVNRRSFRRFMESPAVRKAKEKGVKIIAGGPAAWQWLWSLEEWQKWGVDTVIDGEAEKVVVDLAERALSGGPLPDYIYVGPQDSPSIEEIPVIKGASVNGLVEIMRGCPRGCKFCSVTLRPLRYMPFDKIEAEIKVNLRNGVKSVILHSEDVLLYGADGVKPRPEPLIKLHERVRRLVPGTIAWSHASLAAVKYAEEKHRLVSRIMNDIVLTNQRFLGVEVGIETLSPRLAKIIMPAKSAPYPAEKWPDVVEDAFRIMHENNIIPAGTLILGLPEERPEDVEMTAEMLDRLRPYRSLIVPMFFVPMGVLKNRDWFKRNLLRPEHVEVLKRTLLHSLYWAEDILSKFYLREPHMLPVRMGIEAFIKYARRKAEKMLPKIEAMLRA